jgi:hypothetical protein
MDENFLLSDLQSLCNVGLGNNLELQPLPELDRHLQVAVPTANFNMEEKSMYTSHSPMTEAALSSRRGSMVSNFSTTSQDSFYDGDSQSHGTKRGRTKISDEDLRAKNERRLLQCRVSAKLSRERKKQFIGTLEGQLVQLQQTKVELEAVVALLLCENERLRQARCGGGSQPQNTPTSVTDPMQCSGATQPSPTVATPALSSLAAALPQLPNLQLSSAALESLRTIRLNQQTAGAVPVNGPGGPGSGSVISGSALLTTPASTLPQPMGVGSMLGANSGQMSYTLPSNLSALVNSMPPSTS